MQGKGKHGNRVNFDHPANRGVLSHVGDPRRLQRSASTAKQRPSCRPEDVEDLYPTLGAHPELAVAT